MRPWHHAPLHVLLEQGVYMVTAGTYQKERFSSDGARLGFLHDLLHTVAEETGWRLHAWAVMANHYHIVAASPDDPTTLRRFLGKLHTLAAREVNRLDGTPARKVWHQYWDTRLTHDRSYLARLHYVNHNPVHHGLIPVANQYRWCSAGRFESEVDPGFRRTVEAMPIDHVNVVDDF